VKLCVSFTCDIPIVSVLKYCFPDLQATKEILQQYAGSILPENHPNARLVQKVADRLIRANGLGSGATARNPMHTEKQDNDAPAVKWKVRVINEPSTKNA
jgi:hypothetical protein